MIAWTAFLGWAVWQHAQRTEQPPIYDAASYFQKAHNFWSQVDQGKLFNPLNVEPSFRPPATVLMSYPFGFESDYRGFYFRSIFLPLALLGIAIAIAGFGWRAAGAGDWLLVFFAMYLASLPAFYYFEFSPEFKNPHYWGLVDFFLSGMAALAAACSVRSLARFSIGWIAAATLASALCILIKPSGALVMALVGGIWLGLSALRIYLLRNAREQKMQALRWLWGSILIQALVGLCVLGLAFSSAYLSSANMELGVTAIGILKNEFTVSWTEAREFILHLGLGYAFPVVAALMVWFFGRQLARAGNDSNPWNRPMLCALAAASCAAFVFGAWFWIVGTGGARQIRYFFPFLLVAAIYAVPVIGQLARQLPRWQWLLLSLALLAPAVNLAVMLAQSSPSVAWQKWSGVNLSSGGTGTIAAQAKDLVAEAQREKRDLLVYSMAMNASDANFEAAFDYARIALAGAPKMAIARPRDWQRPTTFRIEDMLRATHWLFAPTRDPGEANAILDTSSIDSFAKERALFQAWAAKLTDKDGVAIVSQTADARVLRIVDPRLLEPAFDALLSRHQWRSIFVDANPKRRLTESETAAALLRYPPVLENVRFGDRFLLRALSPSRAGNDINLRVWWQPLPALKESDWAFFIHLVDEQGRILANNQLPFAVDASTRSGDKPIRFDQITIKNLPGNGSRSLAVGLVRPDQTLLAADRGSRDWHNHRVIVPLPAQPAQPAQKAPEK
jgi:hypothetical protein